MAGWETTDNVDGMVSLQRGAARARVPPVEPDATGA